MERADPKRQIRWLSAALPPIEAIFVERAPLRPGDAWSLDNRYVSAPSLPTASLWANLATFLQLGRGGQAT